MQFYSASGKLHPKTGIPPWTPLGFASLNSHPSWLHQLCNTSHVPSLKIIYAGKREEKKRQVERGYKDIWPAIKGERTVESS